MDMNMNMNIQQVATAPAQLPAPNQPPADAQPPAQTPDEPQDKLCFGKIAQGVVKVALGVPSAIFTGTMNGGIKSVFSSIEAAERGLDIDPQAATHSTSEKFMKGILTIAPAIGAIIASASGLGPIGMLIAGLAAPGVVGGTSAAFTGASEGLAKGFEVATHAANKVKDKVTPKYGEKAGKVAMIGTTIALGMTVAPFMGIMGGLDGGIKFGQKAIGIKKPENTKDLLANIGKNVVVMAGYFKGLLGASGGIVPVVLGSAQGAGAAATITAGAIGGAKGFVEGAKLGWGLASDKVDSWTHCGHCPNN